MARPQTKAALLAASSEGFEHLWQTTATVNDVDRTRPGACEAWSVKDILAHLDEWHLMFLAWEEAGLRGEKPPMPAEGFSWSETPDLNETIYERRKPDSWDDVVQRLRASHGLVLARLNTYDEADLFTKKRYSWTGSTSVGSYAISATSSHYNWATKLIKKAAKTFAMSKTVS